MNPIANALKDRQVELPTAPIKIDNGLTDIASTRFYIIIMTGRSGSTWLASALSQLPDFGNPIEYFSEEALPYYWSYERSQKFEDVFLGIIRKYTSKDGYFGFKINPRRLFWLSELVDFDSISKASKVCWVDVRRINLVDQALSFVVAKKTGVWHDYKSVQARASRNGNSGDDLQQEIVISDWDLWASIIDIVKQEQAIDKYYRRRSIAPLRFWYEDVMTGKQSSLIRLCSFIKPGSDIDVTGVEDGTSKLEKASYRSRKIAFVRQYAAELNEVYIERESIDTQKFGARIKEISVMAKP